MSLKQLMISVVAVIALCNVHIQAQSKPSPTAVTSDRLKQLDESLSAHDREQNLLTEQGKAFETKCSEVEKKPLGEQQRCLLSAKQLLLAAQKSAQEVIALLDEKITLLAERQQDPADRQRRDDAIRMQEKQKSALQSARDYLAKIDKALQGGKPETLATERAPKSQNTPQPSSALTSPVGASAEQENPVAIPPSKAAFGSGSQVSEFSTTPFDIEAEAVAPHFKGHDIVALATLLRKAPALAGKSEYETTQQYENRKDSLALQPISGELKANSYWAFLVNLVPTSSSTTEHTEHVSYVKYDADQQLLTVRIYFGSGYFSSGNRSLDRSLSVVGGSYKDVGTYAKSNAFGATVDVTGHSLVSYEVMGPIFGGKGAGTGIFEQFRATPEQAIQLKPRIRAVVVCHLTPPWYSYQRSATAATINNPSETLFETHTVYVTFEQLWIYDDESGTVLAKVPFPAPGQNEKKGRK